MENILCVIDPTSSAQPALERAVFFAKKTGAALEILICDYDSALSGHRYFDSEPLQHARDKLLEAHKLSLNEYLDDYRDSGVSISTAAIWGHPLYEGIVRYASLSAADIVFKDTHHHPGLGLSSLSNSDWNLIRTCPVALWLVKPTDFATPPRIIAAVDPANAHDKPDGLDADIMQLANYVANAAEGEVHAFHAYDTTLLVESLAVSAGDTSFQTAMTVGDAARKRHHGLLAEVAADHGISDDRTHLVSGETRRVLPELVKTIGASLVVMGAVSRNRLQRVFIGSTAERTLDRLPCDLLIIKPNGFETPIRLSVED